MAIDHATAPASAGERPRAQNLLDVAGELMTAVVLIAGGVFAYGFFPYA